MNPFCGPNCFPLSFELLTLSPSGMFFILWPSIVISVWTLLTGVHRYHTCWRPIHFFKENHTTRPLVVQKTYLFIRLSAKKGHDKLVLNFHSLGSWSEVDVHNGLSCRKRWRLEVIFRTFLLDSSSSREFLVKTPVANFEKGSCMF